MSKLYKPGNGTEGVAFIEAWCGTCARDKSLREGKPIEECGMFTSDTSENNGYGCQAAQNTEAPGCCYTFACPIAAECDEEDPHWCDTYSPGDWMIVHSRFERHNVPTQGRR